MRRALFETTHTNIMSDRSAISLSVLTFAFVMDDIEMRVVARPAKLEKVASRVRCNGSRNTCKEEVEESEKDLQGVI